MKVKKKIIKIFDLLWQLINLEIKFILTNKLFLSYLKNFYGKKHEIFKIVEIT